MEFDPHNLPKEYRFERRLNRANFIDYSLPGFYNLTICTKDKMHWFGHVVNGKMVLSPWGNIAHEQLLWLEKQFQHIRLDGFVVMPNHVHVIVEIRRDVVGNGRDRSLQKPIPELMGAFKTTSSKIIHQRGLPGFRWQKSYYDRLLRTDDELEHARWYIRTNPERWYRDRNNDK